MELAALTYTLTKETRLEGNWQQGWPSPEYKKQTIIRWGESVLLSTDFDRGANTKASAILNKGKYAQIRVIKPTHSQI